MSYKLHRVWRTTETTPPVTEPVTIHEVKRQLNIATSDTSHDVELASKIASAREQFERDTSTAFIKRTLTVKLSEFEEVQFPHGPVSSITSISYYDTGNTSRTLSNTVYQLDGDCNQLRLAYLQVFPATSMRWDAVTMVYVLGSHDDSVTVPAYAKSAMLLLVANEFEQRDMMSPDYTQSQRAYERLVAKYMRSTYP